MVELHTLEDGEQPAEAVAERLIAWLGGASRTLDLALYDVRLPGPVADDVVFLGSFNHSRSGEETAENVLEIGDAALAERLADWIDVLRERYPGGI